MRKTSLSILFLMILAINFQNCSPLTDTGLRISDEDIDSEGLASTPARTLAVKAASRTLLFTINKAFIGNGKLYLRQTLLSKGVDATNYKLVTLRIRAKSQGGAGTAQLIVGSKKSALVRVPGTQAAWSLSSGYVDLNLTVPAVSAADMAGSWQIAFVGNIKVTLVTVQLSQNAAATTAPTTSATASANFICGPQGSVITCTGASVELICKSYSDADTGLSTPIQCADGAATPYSCPGVESVIENGPRQIACVRKPAGTNPFGQ